MEPRLNAISATTQTQAKILNTRPLEKFRITDLSLIKRNMNTSITGKTIPFKICDTYMIGTSGKFGARITMPEKKIMKQ